MATARVRLPASVYPSGVERAVFFSRLTEHLGARADVAATGAITQLPMSGAFLGSRFAVPAGESRDMDTEFGADLRGVTVGYFDTMRIRLVSGREFSHHDDAEGRRVAIVDESLARRFWPGGHAIGRRLRWVRTNEGLEIVGVVASVRHYGLGAPPRETVYRPYEQYAAMPEMFVEARSSLGFDVARAAIIQEVRQLDPNQPVADMRRMDTLVEDSLGQPRFNAFLLAAFAVVALLLAAVGVYGVMSFAVSERTREIGVRMALGADPQTVLWLIVREGARMAFVGVTFGAILALVLAGSLRTMLFGVSPWDTQIFGIVLPLLTLVALTASYLPARRAARLDPSEALGR
jgi:predicted permease